MQESSDRERPVGEIGLWRLHAESQQESYGDRTELTRWSLKLVEEAKGWRADVHVLQGTAETCPLYRTEGKLDVRFVLWKRKGRCSAAVKGVALVFVLSPEH